MARAELELHLAIVQRYRLSRGSMTASVSHLIDAVGAPVAVCGHRSTRSYI